MKAQITRQPRNPQVVLSQMRPTHYPATVAIRVKNGSSKHSFLDRDGKVSPFIIPAGGVIELNDQDPIDAHNLNIFRLMEKSLVPDSHLFRIDSAEMTATVNNVRRELMLDALLLLRPRKGDGRFMASVARRLGAQDVELLNMEQTVSFVEQTAERNPNAVLDILNDVYMEVKFAIDEARSLRVIRVNEENIFFLRDRQMGKGEESAIQYFLEHNDEYSDLKRNNGARFLSTDTAPVRLTPAVSMVSDDDGEETDDFNPNDLKSQVSQAAVTAEEQRRANATKLIDEAIRLGIVTEGSAGEATFYQLGSTKLWSPKKGGSPHEQAVNMLARPQNSPVRKALSDAIDELNAQDQE